MVQLFLFLVERTLWLDDEQTGSWLRLRDSYRQTRISSALDFLTTSRLVGTDPSIAIWITSGLPDILELGRRLYFIGREPVMRISTSLLALFCQSGLAGT